MPPRGRRGGASARKEPVRSSARVRAAAEKAKLEVSSTHEEEITIAISNEIPDPSQNSLGEEYNQSKEKTISEVNLDKTIQEQHHLTVEEIITPFDQTKEETHLEGNLPEATGVVNEIKEITTAICTSQETITEDDVHEAMPQEQENIAKEEEIAETIEPSKFTIISEDNMHESEQEQTDLTMEEIRTAMDPSNEKHVAEDDMQGVLSYDYLADDSNSYRNVIENRTEERVIEEEIMKILVEANADRDERVLVSVGPGTDEEVVAPAEAPIIDVGLVAMSFTVVKETVQEAMTIPIAEESELKSEKGISCNEETKEDESVQKGGKDNSSVEEHAKIDIIDKSGKDEDTTKDEIHFSGQDEGYTVGKEIESSGSDDDEDNEYVDPSTHMPAFMTDRKKEKEFEIFVGGLMKDADEKDLMNIFGKYGEVKTIRIATNPTTHKNKGYAFIRYATIEQAKTALEELKDGAEVKGKRVGVSASLDNDTLYLGNICKSWSKEQVLDALKELGVEQIEEIVVPSDSDNSAKNKGFAFIEFSSHSDAMTAFHRLSKPDAIFGCNRSAKVAFAPSALHPNEELMSQVKTVYIESLPATWDEEKVKEHCKQYGEIEKVEIHRRSTSRGKQFVFVAFTSRKSAVACIEGINNAHFGEENVKMTAHLAKPQNKGKLARRGARGGFTISKGHIAEEASASKMKWPQQHPQLGKANSRFSGRFPQSRNTDFKNWGVPFGGATHRWTGEYFGSNYSAPPPSNQLPYIRSIQGKPPNNFGRWGGTRGGRPNINYAAHVSNYRDPNSPAFIASATSHQNSANVASAGSKRSYSSTESHATHMPPPVKQSRHSYASQMRPMGYGIQGVVAGYSEGYASSTSYPPAFAYHYGHTF